MFKCIDMCFGLSMANAQGRQVKRRAVRAPVELTRRCSSVRYKSTLQATADEYRHRLRARMGCIGPPRGNREAVAFCTPISAIACPAVPEAKCQPASTLDR